MSKTLYAILAFIFLYASCKHDSTETIAEETTIATTATTSTTVTTASTSSTSTTAPVNDSVCFNTQILPLFQSNCAQGGCHDAGSHQEGYTFTSYTGIMKGINDGEIMKEINKGDMPMAPVPQLTSEQKSLLNKWIAEGHKNRICDDPCDPATATFAAGVNTIITTNCTGCHNNNIANGGINLQGYDNVKTQALSGKLVCVIDHGAGCLPMPQNAARLSNNCIQVIKNWIAAGSLNN
jgi:uncharacterized membrane protein